MEATRYGGNEDALSGIKRDVRPQNWLYSEHMVQD